GSDPEHIKVISGHLEAPYPLIDAVVAQAQRSKPVTDEAGKNFVPVTKIFVVRIGEAWKSVILRNVVERDELLRIFDGQRTQQHCVDQTEDSSVCPGAECQGQHRNGSEALLFEQ